jgi:putative oxygen-independent coproporphyrinogen III oxidase
VERGISFYIHIPYCIKRCGYCDFNTYTPAELGEESLAKAEISQRYIDAAMKEVDRAREQLIEDRPIESIFFGGGTPSLMEPSDINRILELIREKFTLVSDCEITMEANPETVERSNLTGFVAAGINRMSFGVQSVKENVLQVLDRSHNRDQVIKACEIAVDLGLENLSIDLIYGAPGESIRDLDESLDFALSLPLKHISAYALIVEPGTKLAAKIKRGEIESPDDDLMADKYELVDSKLSGSAFSWYEISNWAKPGFASRHNQVYWNGGNWWGVGPGAHSYLGQRRWWNIKNPIKYIDALERGSEIIAESELLTDENKNDEKIMLQIRTSTGIDLGELTVDQREVALTYLELGAISESGWVKNRLILTLKGRLIADRIVRDLLV